MRESKQSCTKMLSVKGPSAKLTPYLNQKCNVQALMKDPDMERRYNVPTAHTDIYYLRSSQDLFYTHGFGLESPFWDTILFVHKHYQDLPVAMQFPEVTLVTRQEPS